MAIRNSSVTTVILAGGLGTRIGGDKGMRVLQGKSLLSWVLDVVRRGSDEVLINANDSHQAYAQFACRIIADQMQGWQGPLAGLQAGLSNAGSELVMTVPCDTPFLPADLIARFVEVLRKNETEAAVAKVEGHRQPAIAMYRRTVLPKLDVFLDSGQRKVNDWLDTLRLSEVVFDHAREFDNINTQEDLARANQQDVSLRNRIEAEWKDKK